MIKTNKMDVINHSILEKDKDLLEFVNAYMLAYYKENQQALIHKVNFSYNPFESKYMGYIMKYNEKILPV